MAFVREYLGFLIRARRPFLGGHSGGTRPEAGRCPSSIARAAHDRHAREPLIVGHAARGTPPVLLLFLQRLP
jgi:hypothetical protein